MTRTGYATRIFIGKPIVDTGALMNSLWKTHWCGLPLSHGGMALRVLGRWYGMREFMMLDPRERRLIDLEGENEARAYEEWPRERRLDKPSWCTAAVVALCDKIISEDDPSHLLILADELEMNGYDGANHIAAMREYDTRLDWTILNAIRMRWFVWQVKNGVV